MFGSLSKFLIGRVLGQKRKTRDKVLTVIEGLRQFMSDLRNLTVITTRGRTERVRNGRNKERDDVGGGVSPSDLRAVPLDRTTTPTFGHVGETFLLHRYKLFLLL